MTNAELIEHLKKLPQEKTVGIFYDGGVRGDIDGIVNDDAEIVLVADWSIYRGDASPALRAFEEDKIVFG